MRCEAMAGWGKKGVCDGCAAPLTGKARRWCKGDCDYLYWSNHRWNIAREKALSRSTIFESRSLENVRIVYAKRRGRTKLTLKSRTYIKGYRCMRCGCTTHAPEVNHIIPAMGAHSLESCVHHQENLEVLCRECHLATTAQQRAEGLFKRK